MLILFLFSRFKISVQTFVLYKVKVGYVAKNEKWSKIENTLNT